MVHDAPSQRQSQPLTAAALPRFVWLAFMINLVSMAGFMMVMPLGPDLTLSLGLPSDDIGTLTGWATLAAAVAGLCCAPWLDRFNRKPLLIGCLMIKSCCLALAAMAENVPQLYLWYLSSALLAGPLSAVLFAAVLDVTSPTERGRAMALMGSAFPLAAILFVPFALQLALWLDWRWAFGCFVVMGFLLAMVAVWWMPSLRGHAQAGLSTTLSLLQQSRCQFAVALVAITMAGHFLLIPHLSAYFQFNLGFAREHISYLYAAGGVFSLCCLQFCGTLADRGYQQQLVYTSSFAMALVVMMGLIMSWLPIWSFFAMLMACSAVRSAVMMGSFSDIPLPAQRASMMSLLGTVSNIAAGSASILSAGWLHQQSQQLVGFSSLAWGNISAIVLSMVLWRYYQQTRRSELS